MCEIKSALILKNSVICPLDTDRHEDMIKQAGLDDTTTTPKFVRVEMTPADGNLFNHDPANWQLKVDQDYKPGWFDAEDARRRMLPELKQWWAERFVLNAQRGNIAGGRWFVGAGGVVQHVWAGGVVQDVLAGGVVRDVRAGSVVQHVLDGGVVQHVLAGGVVRDVRAGGVVQHVWAGGVVQDVLAGGVVQHVRAGSVVQHVRDGGVVQDVLAGGVAIYWGKPKTPPTITDTGIAIYHHEKKIIVADKDLKLVQFKAPKGDK